MDLLWSPGVILSMFLRPSELRSPHGFLAWASCPRSCGLACSTATICRYSSAKPQTSGERARCVHQLGLWKMIFQYALRMLWWIDLVLSNCQIQSSPMGQMQYTVYTCTYSIQCIHTVYSVYTIQWHGWVHGQQMPHLIGSSGRNEFFVMSVMSWTTSNHRNGKSTIYSMFSLFFSLHL